MVTAAPNFAYEWTAQRASPVPGDEIDLGRVSMIIGSEPVSIGAVANPDALRRFVPVARR